MAIDLDGLLQRIGPGKELFRHPVSKQNAAAADLHILCCQIAPQLHIMGVVFRILGRAAADRQVAVGGDVPVFCGMTKGPQFRAHQIRVRHALPDQIRVLHGQGPARHDFASFRFAHGASGGVLLHLKGLGSKHSQLCFNAGLDDRDGGHHRNDGGDADDDADQRQTGAQLVGADGRQRHSERFCNKHDFAFL